MMTGIPSVNSISLCYYAGTLAILALFARYDAKHHKVRNRSLILFLPWCLASIPVRVHAGLSPSLLAACLTALLGFLAGGGLFLITAIATKGGIGGGDIKLVALLGLCYGMEQTATSVTIACLIALIHVSDIAEKQGRMPKNIPFVPYLTAGCLIQTIILLYFWGG